VILYCETEGAQQMHCIPALIVSVSGKSHLTFITLCVGSLIELLFV